MPPLPSPFAASLLLPGRLPVRVTMTPLHRVNFLNFRLGPGRTDMRMSANIGNIRGSLRSLAARSPLCFSPAP
jgi:hypothetical protein